MQYHSLNECHPRQKYIPTLLSVLRVEFEDVTEYFSISIRVETSYALSRNNLILGQFVFKLSFRKYVLTQYEACFSAVLVFEFLRI